MRLLVMDHYFSQDIDALRTEAGDRAVLDVMGFAEPRAAALRVMAPEVADGLEAFASPENASARERFAEVLRRIIEDRFTRAPFDALVMPSDTFFYVRDAPAAAHALGVPFIVVQKETTISDHTMREHSQLVRRYAPPTADLMTVCSERHKEFWLRSGGDAAMIHVTGQPRFDFYLRPDRWPRSTDDTGPTVLFLSYQADAYHPDEGRSASAWNPLHRETEAGLHELARQGWKVLIKPHPQQSLEGVREWRKRAGGLWGKRVRLVDPDADVRKLIVTADVTVGFQSTALLEAMLAGRPAVYTGWDERAAAIGGDLVPFHEWDDVITVVREPGELAEAVLAARGTVPDDQVLARRRTIAEEYLGPLDGLASSRALAAVFETANEWAGHRAPGAHERRDRLSSGGPAGVARRGRAELRIARRRIAAFLAR